MKTKNRNKALIAALAAAAVLLAAAHLRLPHSAQVWRTESSAAAARTGERMEIAMPQGDVAVNRATLQELDTLESVGPALAQRIVDERETNGDFHYPEDLISVKGIGEKTLEKMREQLALP